MGSNLLFPCGGPRRLLVFLLAISLMALTVAFVLERHLGVVGCPLCVYQRIPFAVAAICSLIGIMPGGSARRLRAALVLCAITFAFGAGLATYHVGVQQGWWLEPAVCEAGAPLMTGPLDLRAEVRAEAPLPPCDEIDWSIFGISLAALNAMLCGTLALGCAVGLMLPRTRQPFAKGMAEGHAGSCRTEG
ncbi:MAG: disulfide bond formation protein B [Rhodospirillales bacterium]|jgi:disulfide bond formation protein DsbB|nr:disulfide bond formation protein B [Rhodospirillales bacterium]